MCAVSGSSDLVVFLLSCFAARKEVVFAFIKSISQSKNPAMTSLWEEVNCLFPCRAQFPPS